MPQALRKAAAVLFALLVLSMAVVLAYSLPRHAVLKITGGEVRRVDKEGQAAPSNSPLALTRDVFFINTAELHEPQVHVFRNEDTHFGFPWYLKFDSAEVQGRAQLLAQGDRPALVTYYGWRIDMLNKFPNAVDVEPWDREQPPFPWFDAIVLGAWVVLVLIVFWKLLRTRKDGAA